jgi:hypothetical protein
MRFLVLVVLVGYEVWIAREVDFEFEVVRRYRACWVFVDLLFVISPRAGVEQDNMQYSFNKQTACHSHLYTYRPRGLQGDASVSLCLSFSSAVDPHPEPTASDLPSD